MNETTKMHFELKRFKIETEQLRSQVRFAIERIKTLEAKIDAFKPVGNDKQPELEAVQGDASQPSGTDTEAPR